MTSRAGRTARAFFSLALLALLMIGAPIALVAASTRRFGSPNPLAGAQPPWRWTGEDIDNAARQPLTDDTVIDAIVRLGLVVIWIAVVLVVVTTIVETVHVVRHRFPLPSVRGLRWAQHLGRFIAAGLIVIGPWTTARASLAAPQLAVAFPTTEPAAAVVDLPSASVSTRSGTTVVQLGGHVTTADEWRRDPTATETPIGHDPVPGAGSAGQHVVERGESVWSIASDLARGDATTTVEIAEAILDANLGTVMNDGQRFTNPAYIEAAWVLEIPAAIDGATVPRIGTAPGPAQTAPEQEPLDQDRDEHVDQDVDRVHVVEAGDTLSAIAAERLGDASLWPEIWEANARSEMDGGRTFDDPNLILPGWELTIPPTAERGERPPTTQDDDPAASDDATGPDDTDLPDESTAPDDAEIPVDATLADVPAQVAPPAADTGRDPIDDRTGSVPASASPREPGGVAPPAVPGAGTESTVPTTGPRTTSPSTSTTAPAAAAGPSGGAGEESGGTSGTPGPIRIEHAAVLAAGVVALVAVRRRRRLRSAGPRTRIPEPLPDVSATERRLRTVDPGERAIRLDVAVRAAAAELISTDARIGLAALATDGDIELRLTGSAELPPPWVGAGAAWSLPATVPIEMLADAARRVGQPCIALVQVGVADDGSDILIDLEASGLLTVEADATVADEVVTAIAAGLGASVHAEVAHLITVSLAEEATLGHRNAHRADTVDAALELAADLVGSTITRDESTFTLRSRQTGGEVWEPAVILLGAADDFAPASEIAPDDRDRQRPHDGDHDHVDADDPHREDRYRDDLAPDVPGRTGLDQDRLSTGGRSGVVTPGHGLAVVAATSAGSVPDANRLVACAAGWALEAFGCTTELTPVGLPAPELRAMSDLLDDADRPLVDDGATEWSPIAIATSGPASDTADRAGDGCGPASSDGDVGGDVESDATEFIGTEHEILVSVMGPVAVTDRDGTPGVFERSKTIELIAWLATHRANSTRAAARTALWELDVRDATFANVVSEARRGLARLVPPRDGVEWLERTLNERLPLDPRVVTDAQLIEERLRAATLQPPAQAIETLRPAVDLVRDIPFAGTSYLWPDAEGLTSNLVLLATSVTVELAAHGLATGDIDLVFWATARGLKALPGHEESIGLRMKAHAEAGDLSGVRHEWDAYERVIVADAWSDGEPAPKLLELRRELLDARG